MRFEVSVSDREVERKLRNIAAAGRSTEPAFVRMLGDLQDAERSWFETRGEGTWAAHDEETTRRHGEHELLDLMGTLLRSLVQTHAPYAVRETSDAEARFGTWDPTAHLQAGGHGAPKRAVLAPLARSPRKLSERLREHILAHN